MLLLPTTSDSVFCCSSISHRPKVQDKKIKDWEHNLSTYSRSEFSFSVNRNRNKPSVEPRGDPSKRCSICQWRPPWTQPTASRGHYNGRSGSVHQNILTPKHASAQEVNRWRWQWVSGVYIGSRRPFCAIRVSVLSTETYNILCVSRECAHSPTGGAMALKGRFQNTAKRISELKWLESESWVDEFRWRQFTFQDKWNKSVPCYCSLGFSKVQTAEELGLKIVLPVLFFTWRFMETGQCTWWPFYFHFQIQVT